MEVVPKEEPRSDDGSGPHDSPGSGGGALPAAADGAAGGSQGGGEDNCVISLLDDSESEDVNGDEDSGKEDDWDEEDGSEDESDAEPCAPEQERPRLRGSQHGRSQPTAPHGAAADAAAQAGLGEADEAATVLHWDKYSSLARTAGLEPPGRTSGLQTHKSCEGIVVQMAVPAKTGNVCPHVVGVFSCRQAAARARDVGHAWRALHGIERHTWETCQWAYPDADYQSDVALLAALRPLTHFKQLCAAVRQLFPPPLSVRKGQQRRDCSKQQHTHRRRRQAWHGDGEHPAVDKIMSEAALRSQSIRFKAEDFQLLGWQGSLECPPRLRLTLCEGAEPGGLQGASPLSPGSRGRSPVEVEFGVLGRDGARMVTASATRLLRRLELQPGDVLRFQPAPDGAAGTSEGRLAAQLSVVRTQEEEEEQAAPAAAAAGQVAAGDSGGHAGAHRRKGRPARVDGGLRWASADADEAATAGEPPLVCANCGCTATYQWRPLPGSKHKKLCGTCRAYYDNHGGKMRPSKLWAPWKPRDVKAEREEEEVWHELPAKRQRVEQPAVASPAAAAAAASPAAGATPARQHEPEQQQQQQRQCGAPPAAVATPPAAVAPPAAAAAAMRSEGLLPADASWERCHARLDVLLLECGVDELDAQDFKFALLGMPEAVRRSHFLEIQARHADGRHALACRWSAARAVVARRQVPPVAASAVAGAIRQGRACGSVAAMEQVKGQLTLFDLKKVVSSKQTWGMFTQEELQQHHTVLLDPTSSKHKLLHVLRKLDCYRLQLADLSSTHIGRAAATLAVHHPREEVRRLAGALVDKWRASFDAELFAELPYDAAAAAEAPEGDASEFQVVAPPPPPPPPAAQPTRVQPARKERAQRIKEEEAYLEGSDVDAISEKGPDLLHGLFVRFKYQGSYYLRAVEGVESHGAGGAALMVQAPGGILGASCSSGAGAPLPLRPIPLASVSGSNPLQDPVWAASGAAEVQELQEWMQQQGQVLLVEEAQAVQRLLIRGPMPVESLAPLVDLPTQMGRPGPATLGRFVERRPHLFRLRRFPNSPVALVAAAPGAQAWLAYKRRLLQFLADHGRVDVAALPRPPPDLLPEMRNLVRSLLD
ncbi:putative mediator of RNA polymerase II transcription subunit 26c isoform B [Chlorella sorokiniana]|uniref:Mediator of RNA polymerase II transcription subunit 26c isoform B n=1 Tax=Chlorella sorokiniana TaxID=3076 RepID=A0A2P6TYL3_CHLSO|nr:putative mediator of RNA polymerase II transcription subunit 26c isoform B [Chlorella sorokiniana]|eukprot:PRW59151.1 putative mediator of RNA polymerase II transcription subunit 26c isoform B [Chlorella sorokiniana]